MDFKELVNELSKTYEIEYYVDLERAIFEEYEMVMEYNEYKDRISIYRPFTYLHDESYSVHIITSLEKLIFLQRLIEVSGELPSIDINIPMGCPFDEEQVGYFNIESNLEKVHLVVDWFEKATDESGNTLNENLLSENYPEEVEAYRKLLDKGWNGLKILKKDGWNCIKRKNESIEEFADINKIFINDEGSVVVGLGDISFKKILDKLGNGKYQETTIYKGINYCLGKLGNDIIGWNLDLLKRVNDIIAEMELDFEFDTFYYIHDNKFLIIRCCSFWAIIAPLKSNSAQLKISELKSLKEIVKQFKEYFPEEKISEEIDFSKITASQFEDLCRDLLAEFGFKNIYTRGNTNASDGGVDIECDEEVQQIFGTYTRHWIFQCKHMKKQLDRKDIAEIPTLLKEFEAGGYGLFYTNVYTPQTLDRIKNICKSEKYSIKCWDNFQLIKLVESYPRIKEKYFDIL